jgi:hypothetical protein
MFRFATARDGEDPKPRSVPLNQRQQGSGVGFIHVVIENE